MVGNKLDQEAEYREVARAQGEAAAKDLGAIYIETSARTGYNVKELFAIMLQVQFPFMCSIAPLRGVDLASRPSSLSSLLHFEAINPKRSPGTCRPCLPIFAVQVVICFSFANNTSCIVLMYMLRHLECYGTACIPVAYVARPSVYSSELGIELAVNFEDKTTMCSESSLSVRTTLLKLCFACYHRCADVFLIIIVARHRSVPRA